MADELDLDHGEPSRTEQRRARRSQTSSSSVGGESKTLTEKLDRELLTRITESLDRIREWREARDDMELAEAIEQDKGKMAQGLVSLTHAIQPLRQPLVYFLGFIEPVLAFGRVTRILVTRWVTRRQRQAEDLAAAQAEWDAANNEQAQAQSIFK